VGKVTIDTEVKYLKGVGPKRAKRLEKLGVRTVEDLLYLLPRRYVDRSKVQKIAHLKGGSEWRSSKPKPTVKRRP